MTSILEAAKGDSRDGERLRSSLLFKIKQLDDFPKTDMFIKSSGKVEPRWGILVRNIFDENLFTRIILVTWHGLQVADNVEAFGTLNQIQPEKYPDFESIRKASAEEYTKYYGEAYTKVGEVLKTQFKKKAS